LQILDAAAAFEGQRFPACGSASPPLVRTRPFREAAHATVRRHASQASGPLPAETHASDTGEVITMRQAAFNRGRVA